MCKIEKVAFLCKIDGKFASIDVDALTLHKSYMSLFNNNKKNWDIIYYIIKDLKLHKSYLLSYQLIYESFI